MPRSPLAVSLVCLLVGCSVPTDEEFCDHVLTIQMKEEKAEGGVTDDDRKICLDHLPTLKNKLGDDWNAFARCAIKSYSEAALASCSPKLAEMVEEDKKEVQDQMKAAAEEMRRVEAEKAAAVEAAKKAAKEGSAP